MSAASNMNEDRKHSLLWHEELPVLLSLARQGLTLKKEIFAKKGLVWISKQRLSRATKEALMAASELGKKGRKSLQDVAHPTVRRGECPTIDSIIDCLKATYEVERCDMMAFLRNSETLTVPMGGSTVTAAAASVGAVPEAVANGMVSSSRKRSYSRVRKDDTANKRPKGPKGANVATSQSFHSGPASIERHRSADRKASVATGSGKGPDKSQTDILMNWMKQNAYNPSPDLFAIDELVESTKLKPSQIVAWTKEMGDSVAAKLDSTGSAKEQPEIIVVDDDDDDDDDDYSVPELGEEDDACNGLVAGVDVEVKSKVVDGAALDGLCLDFPESFLDSLLLDLDLDFGDLDVSGSIRTDHSGEQKSSAPCVRLTACEEFELFEYLSSQAGNDDEFDYQGKLRRPSKRARTDSLDSLFALLD